MTSPTDAVADTSEPVPAQASGTPEGAGAAAGALAGRSPGQLAWVRFKRDRTGIACAATVAVFLLIAVAAPLITRLYGQDPYTFHSELLNDVGLPLKPNGGIDGTHWFGIEPNLGRDVFALLMYGIRTSLGISLCVTAASVAFGVLVGLVQGFAGGRTDYVMGRFTDLMLAFPQQLFFIAFTPVLLAVFVKPTDDEPTYLRFLVIVLVQFVLGWMSVARLVRSQILTLREREFVEAARLAGASPWRIIRKELLPNTWSTVLVQTTLLLPLNVTVEAGLSYIGVGMQNPTPDWGLMFQTAATYYRADITYLFFPGIAMLVFVVAFNLLGDSVRDALDPKAKR